MSMPAKAGNPVIRIVDYGHEAEANAAQTNARHGVLDAPPEPALAQAGAGHDINFLLS
jgi:hypothetical protein